MNYYKGLEQAIKEFWETRNLQKSSSQRQDVGERKSVTAGKHMDSFLSLFRQIICEQGVDEANIFLKKDLELPGYFRPAKQWDLLVIKDGRLIAVIETKSHIGPSFGNNFNNRIEEAVGSATDLKKAFNKGVFGDSPLPFVGYFLLVEKCEASLRPVKVKSPHFDIFPEFAHTSYLQRYELFCNRLVKEKLYSAAALITSDRNTGPQGKFEEPAQQLGFSNFISSLIYTLKKLK